MATLKQHKDSFEKLKSKCETKDDAIKLAEYYAKRFAQLSLWNESFAEKILKDSKEVKEAFDKLKK